MDRRSIQADNLTAGTRPSLGTVLFLACVAAGGCDRAVVKRSQPTVGARDSSAMRVHEYTADDLARAQEWIIDTIPVTRVDGRQPDLDFQRVQHAVLLPDGRIAALRMVDPRVFIVGADGRTQRALGRLGSGPGDFTAPAGLVLAGGDSLYVPDGANGRINWLTPDSGFVGSVPMQAGLSFCESPRGLLPDGRVVLLYSCTSQAREVGRPMTPLRVAGPDRSVISVIDSLPSVEMVTVETRYRGRRRAGSMILRFGSRPVATVWDSTVAVGRNGALYEIDRLSADGKVLDRIRLRQPRRAVTRAMRDAAIASELNELSQPGSEAMVDPAESRRLARDVPFADSLAHYEYLFATPAGILWAVAPIVAGDRGWTAIVWRPDGTIAARATAHRAGVPLHFRDDRVLVRELDADGTSHLAVYPIRRK